MLQQQLSKALQSAITSAVTQHLASKGYAVLDNLFGKNIADNLRAEVINLFQDGHMHKNCTHLGMDEESSAAMYTESKATAQESDVGSNRVDTEKQVREGQTQLLEKAQIHEAELTLDPRIQDKTPLCSQLNSDRTLATMLSLHLPQVRLDSQAIKLQYNSGQGGCFPMHLDTDEMLDGRKVTAIFYLNPHWDASQGGHLKLYPWPEPPIEIHPRHDRLVLFSSARMLHRVTPSYTNNTMNHGQQPVKGKADQPLENTGPASFESRDPQQQQHVHEHQAISNVQTQIEATGRCCFTIWLAQSAGRHRRHSNNSRPKLSSLQPCSHPSEDPDAAIRFLLHPYVRPHVLKLVYEDEWIQSIKESHPPGPALDSLLLQQANEVAVVRRALGKYESLIKDMTLDPNIANHNGLSWF